MIFDYHVVYFKAHSYQMHLPIYGNVKDKQSCLFPKIVPLFIIKKNYSNNQQENGLNDVMYINFYSTLCLMYVCINENQWKSIILLTRDDDDQRNVYISIILNGRKEMRHEDHMVLNIFKKNNYIQILFSLAIM